MNEEELLLNCKRTRMEVRERRILRYIRAPHVQNPFFLFLPGCIYGYGGRISGKFPPIRTLQDSSFMVILALTDSRDPERITISFSFQFVLEDGS